MDERVSSTSGGRGSAEQAGGVGDWLVIPGNINEHLWRWGRITGLVAGDGPLRYRIRWTGADQDSVVLPPPDSRIESSTVWPKPAGDAIGTWPDGPAGGRR
jgi:Domain of unknown function (DUF1918)